MQPLPQPQPSSPQLSASSMAPSLAMQNSPSSGEPDGGPLPQGAPQGQQAQAPQAAPQAGATQGGMMAPQPGGDASGEPDGGPLPGDQGAPQGGQNVASQSAAQNDATIQALQTQLQGMSPDDKQFFAAHMTPEVVKVIGLINGPVVAGYLGRFADPNKVLVPVPRQMANQIAAKMQSQGQSPQGPSDAPQQGGMMSPSTPAQATSPNREPEA